MPTSSLSLSLSRDDARRPLRKGAGVERERETLDALQSTRAQGIINRGVQEYKHTHEKNTQRKREREREIFLKP